MNKIRDLIYDFNDIFVALLIVLLTAGIIFWRVGVIMDYPSYLAAKTGSETEVDLSGVDLTPEDVDENLNGDPDDVTVPDDGQGSEQTQGGEGGEQTSDGQEQSSQGGEQGSQGEGQQQGGQTATKDVTITIPQGSYGSNVAKILYDAGVVPSTQSFLDELKAQGKENRIQVGDFKIPAGSSISDIVKIVTRTM